MAKVPWTDDEMTLLTAHPDMAAPELSMLMSNRHTPAGIRGKRFELRQGEEATPGAASVTEDLSAEDESLLAIVRRAAKKAAEVNLFELADALDMSPRRTRESVQRLQTEGYRLQVNDAQVSMPPPMRTGFNPVPLEHFYDGGWYHIGVVSDTHLANEHSRLDMLNAAYDFFAAEGIRTVLHAGNYIDGERHTKNELLVRPGFAHQAKYFAINYPERDGIETWYVDGDDHEGWYYQDVGVNVGQVVQDTAQRMGRSDLKFGGYMEWDIPFYARPDGEARGERPAILKLLHGGGGSAYAVSYTLQKLIESYSGGEKPQILVVGHYHKQLYFHWRNIHAMLAACGCDQTLFMRKLRLAAIVGFHTIRFKVSADGTVNRFQLEWFPWYTEGYYRDRWTAATDEEQVAPARPDSRYSLGRVAA